MKITSLRTISASVALLSIVALPVAAQTTSTEAAQLRAQIASLQQTVAQQNTRLAQLEQAKSSPALASSGTVTAPSDVKEGYFVVPGTGFQMRLNLKPRMDVMVDNRYAGSYAVTPGSGDSSTSPFRFVAALIPTSNDQANFDAGLAPHDNTTQAAFSGRSSAISFDAQTLGSAAWCPISVHYDNDFFGHEYGGSDLYIRVNQVYVKIGGLTLGKAVLPLEDSDMWFDSYDLGGASGMIFARRLGVRCDFAFDDGFSSAAGLNSPATDSSLVRAPDFTANVRWSNDKIGHVQLSGLAGQVTDRNDVGERKNAFIWGLNLSAGINISSNDLLQLQGTYGKGMFPYSNDWFVAGQYDFGTDGSINPLTYKAFLAGFSHKWSGKFRSTVGYSMTFLDDVSPNSFVTYHRTQYALANVIWTPIPRMDISLEVLYGSNQIQSGEKGNVTRVLLSVGYSLF